MLTQRAPRYARLNKTYISFWKTKQQHHTSCTIAPGIPPGIPRHHGTDRMRVHKTFTRKNSLPSNALNLHDIQNTRGGGWDGAHSARRTWTRYCSRIPGRKLQPFLFSLFFLLLLLLLFWQNCDILCVLLWAQTQTHTHAPKSGYVCLAGGSGREWSSWT